MNCPNCNMPLSEGARFCSSCGAPLGEAAYDRPVTQNDPYAEPKVVLDSGNDKFMGILSYVGILALIPFFTKPNSPFVRYHAVRGMNLFLLELIAGVAASLIGAVIRPLGSVVSWLVSVASIALSIIGIINVCNGERKDLPFIGTIRLIKE